MVRGPQPNTVLVLLLLIPLGCDSKPAADVVELSGPTMGTRYTVRVARGGHFRDWPPNIQAVQQRIDARLAEINRQMSTYDKSSELSKFNRLNNTDWFGVSSETAEVVAAALEIAKRTSGSFDPTVGPLVNLWGFGPDKAKPTPPTKEKIDAALATTGYKRVQVRHDPPAVRKELADIYLDLSGIAKGYASDQVSELLAELGYQNSMVEIGGEVRTRGQKTDGASWRIGIEKPDDTGRPVQLAVSLDDAGMATSGDYRNFFEHNGVRYSHTIDPTTGQPVKHQLAAVSVIADSSMEADALATAMMVMGDERGYDWCEQQQIAALFLVRKKGIVVERKTTKFKEQEQ